VAAVLLFASVVHGQDWHFGFDPADRRDVLLVFGGSLGAASINAAVLASLPELMTRNIRLIWQTGASGAEAAAAAAKHYDAGTVCVRRFIDKMEFAYALCTVAVCRAGATTIAELTRVGKPSILVPYPFAAANHQEENARTLVDAGAAVLVHDANLGIALLPSLDSLLGNRPQLQQMGAACLSLAKPNAARDIAQHIAALAARPKQK